MISFLAYKSKRIPATPTTWETIRPFIHTEDEEDNNRIFNGNHANTVQEIL
ncbi:MAG: hypothetical protein IJ659_06150 [Alloprevotella sp.]|nr:hypothetical protein [Alloprevotella sp.]